MCNNQDGFYPEGVQLQQIDPLVERALQYAERVGHLSAENRFVSGEAQTYRRKLEDAEVREARLAGEVTYLKRDNGYLDKENTEVYAKLDKLQKKLAPKPKKVAKVTKKAKK